MTKGPIVMKIEYSAEVDALYVYLDEVEVVRSVEPDAGIVVDFDKAGAVVGVEFLDASQRFDRVDAALMLADSGPDYSKVQAQKIRSILSKHTSIASLVQDDVD